MDLYRINNEEELYEIGFLEMIDSDAAISIIEWPQIASNLIKKDCINIEIKFTEKGCRLFDIEVENEQ